MQVLLVLATDDTLAVVGQVASLAGFQAIGVRDDEVVRALAGMRPAALLVDAALAVDASTIGAARRAGARVLFFSPALSTYDLVEHARRRGVAYWTLLSGPTGLRQAVAGDAVPLPASTPDERLAPLAELALAHSDVSRILRERSQNAVATARELRATREVRVAACRASVGALRDSVHAWAVALRQAGTPLERVVALMRDAVARGVADATGEAASGERLDEAARWAEEAYRAA